MKILYTTLFVAGTLLTNLGAAQNVFTYFDSDTAQISDDLIFDAEGNMYGSDWDGSRIYRVSPEGDVSVFADGFDTPNGLAFDSAGNMFMCDNQGNAIHKLDPDGNFLETYAINSPSGIIKTYDSDTLIFTTYANHSLKKLAPDGTMIDMFSNGVLNGPVGLVYDDQNQLYVGNFTDREIYRIDGDELTYIATMPGNGISLGFLAFSQGHLYATAFQSNRIYKINPFYTDSIVTHYGIGGGNVDGPVEEARFSRPNGIRASSTGDTLFISQYTNGNVRFITDLTLGLYDAFDDAPEFSVYPNPSSEFIEISTADESLDEVRLFDVKGRVVKGWKGLELNQKRLDLSDLEPGTYLVEVTTESGRRGAQKIIKN